MTEKSLNCCQRFKNWIFSNSSLLITFAFLLLIIPTYVMAMIKLVRFDFTEGAKFGDMIGPILSFIAIIFAWLSIRYQIKEMQITNEANKKSIAIITMQSYVDLHKVQGNKENIELGEKFINSLTKSLFYENGYVDMIKPNFEIKFIQNTKDSITINIESKELNYYLDRIYSNKTEFKKVKKNMDTPDHVDPLKQNKNRVRT